MLKAILLLITLCSIQMLGAQSKSSIVKCNKDTVFFADTNRIIVKRQTLIAGYGSAEKGWYANIGFKNSFALPLLINREADLKYSYDGRSNPEQDRANDLVNTSIHAGDFLIVKKIRQIKNKYEGRWYKAILISQRFPRLRFYCNVEKALDTNEIDIP